MTAELIKAFETVVTQIGNLTSDPSFKTVAGVFDQIPQLKEQIASKDVKLLDFEKEITGLKSQHETQLKENLELYRKAQNNLESENKTLVGKISTLETSIKQRDAALSDHTRTQSDLQGKLEKATKQLSAEKDKLLTANGDMTKLLQNLKGKDVGIERLKENVRNERMESDKVKNLVQDLRKRITSLEENLASKASRLDEIDGFTTKLQEVDETVWIKRLDEVWDAAYNVVTSLLNKDIEEEKLRDKTAWKKLKESDYLDRGIPLPRSNSRAAKQMRIATLLAILARSITQHVFQPTYLLEDKEDRDEIRLLLVNLAVKDSKKESFCRSLLLSIFPEEQAKNARKAIDRVVRDVAWCVQDLALDTDMEQFRSGVETVAQKAHETWKLVQNTREKFEPYFHLINYDDFEWNVLSFSSGRAITVPENAASASKDDEPVFVILPRIYAVADSEPEPVTPGVVVMRSQSTAAMEEVESNISSSPTAGRAGPRSREIRSRTKSISTNGTNGFLPRTNQSAVH